MFDNDVVELDTAGTLAATAGELAAENEAARRRMLLAVHFADLHPSPAMIPGDHSVPGGERALLYGGPGCPGIAEFAVAEFAVVLGVSTESAAKHIGQALALRHRLPQCWTAVISREATPWKARQVATACQELSLQAAALVDATVAPIIDTVGPIQLRNIIKAAIWDADPEAARAAAEQKARERGVWTGRSDEHGTTTIFVKADTGSVIRFNATVNQVADALAALGDPDPRQLLRAKAIGILADPAFAHQLIEVARHLATTQPPASPTATDNASTMPARNTSASSDLTTPPRPTTAAAAAAAPAPADQAMRPATPPPPAPASSSAPSTSPSPAEDISSAHLPYTDTTSTAPDLADQAPATTATGQATTDPVSPTLLSEDTPTEPDFAVDVTKDGEPAHDLFLHDEPTPNTEADRDRDRANPHATEELIAGMDTTTRQDLAAKLSAIKAAADHANQTTTGTRPGRTKLYVHLTDETLLAGGGVMRIEDFGPIYTNLTELLGHDRITIQPVINLHDHINVNAYEIPHRLREHLKLTYPVEQFPYGPAETTHHTDLDHVVPYDPAGAPGQTSTTNLRPLRRRSHRIKTHAPGWKTRTLTNNTTEWTTPHGYTFHVIPTGTHPIRKADL